MQQYQHAIEILSDSATETYHFCILGIARFRGREERLERDEAGSEGEDGTPARFEDVEADEACLGRDVCERTKGGDMSRVSPKCSGPGMTSTERAHLDDRPAR